MDFVDRHRWLVVTLLAMPQAIYVVSLPPWAFEPLAGDWLGGYSPPVVGLLPEVPLVRPATPEEVRRGLRAPLGSGWPIVRTQVASLTDPPSGRELVDRMLSQVSQHPNDATPSNSTGSSARRSHRASERRRLGPYEMVPVTGN
jgi:hypothetical protein